jgi:hypothetical protein
MPGCGAIDVQGQSLSFDHVGVTSAYERRKSGRFTNSHSGQKQPFQRLVSDVQRGKTKAPFCDPDHFPLKDIR